MPAALKLSTAILLMGLPFLALAQTGTLPGAAEGELEEMVVAAG